MIAAFIVLAAVALVASATTGWFVASRAHTARYRALEQASAASQARADAAEARTAAIDERLRRGEATLARRDTELAAAREANQATNEQVHAGELALAAVRQRATLAEAAVAAAQREIARLTAAVAQYHAEIATLKERLSDHDRSQAREGRAVKEVKRVLAPLMERERMAHELASIEVGGATRGDLPRVMDAIAKIGNFSSVVLSDEVGLPLAVNAASQDGDMIAGLWSMLLTLADRIASSGAAPPMAVVVHDAANQTILHRLFASSGSRFLLTATSRARSLDPAALDPALDKLERLLAGSALAS